MQARALVVSSVVLLMGGLCFAIAGQAVQQEAPPKIESERFEEAIQAFEAEDKASPPRPGAVVVTGSSSVRRWHPTIQEDLAPLTIIPRGFGGSALLSLDDGGIFRI